MSAPNVSAAATRENLSGAPQVLVQSLSQTVKKFILLLHVQHMSPHFFSFFFPSFAESLNGAYFSFRNFLFSFDHCNSRFDSMSLHLSQEAQCYYIQYVLFMLSRPHALFGLLTTSVHSSICNNCSEVNTGPQLS